VRAGGCDVQLELIQLHCIPWYKPLGYEDQSLLSVDTRGQGVAVKGLVSKMRSIVEGLLGVLLAIGRI
jgi:hypothetical protein